MRFSDDIFIAVGFGFVLGCIFMAILLGAIMAYHGWDHYR